MVKELNQLKSNVESLETRIAAMSTPKPSSAAATTPSPAQGVATMPTPTPTPDLLPTVEALVQGALLDILKSAGVRLL